MNKEFVNQSGSSLIELLAVLLIIAIMMVIAVPLVQRQLADRQLDMVARNFVRHANFARNQALYLGEFVQLVPHNERYWDDGWIVQSGCFEKSGSEPCNTKNWLSQESVFPVYFKNQAFVDPHSGRKGILFNSAGAAKTSRGGFVANRLILGHHNDPVLERQIISGGGGRWRICNPRLDSKACK